MTEVAKPVIVAAARRAQAAFTAVIRIRVAVILNASAKVSSISTPLIIIPKLPVTGMDDDRAAYAVVHFIIGDLKIR